MSDLIYELKGLAQQYGPREVLRTGQLAIEAGKIYGVMGPSGAGKSTLLRLLNLLELPTRGKLYFMGKDVYGKGSKVDVAIRRRVTMVFQRPVLFNATVSENVAYGLKVRGEREPQLGQRVAAALRWVGLQDMAEQNARSLSGGEAQRTALARAAVLGTDVLLLDEPTANLDPGNVALMEEFVQQLNQERGTTVVLVTHNMFQARRVAHESVFICDGEVVETGPTEKIFTVPRNERTAAFVAGKMVC